MAILKPDKVNKWNGLKVNEYFLTKHNPNKIDMPMTALPSVPIGVTIHNTGAISVSSSTTMAEQYTRATVNGNMKDVRVHFYVDDVCAWQNLPFTLSGWHSGDGNGNGNRKTISIEIIGNSAKAEANGIKLAAYLLNKYNLTAEKNLFTHTHWLNVMDGKTGSIDYLNTAINASKMCPIYILPHWNQFKNKVKASLSALKGEKQDNIETKTSLYRVRKNWEDEKSQIGAYSVLENAKKACKTGYKVFDEKGNIVYDPTASKTTIDEKINVKYRVYANKKWYSEVINYNNINEDGYAGVENNAIRGLAIKSTKGTLKYRVHVKGGGWLGWISKYNYKDWVRGCAGVKTKDIDGIQIDLQGVPNYEVKYRVSNIGTNSYLPWVIGYNNSNSNGYAGIFGKSIDKVQIEIVKV